MTASDKPLYSFVSHIDGKNARVEVWPDRLEWERKALSAAKVITGVGFITGFRNKDSQMVPIKGITSVTTKKGLGFNTEMFVNTAAGRMGFRASHKEAATAKDLIQKLMLSDGAPVAAVPSPAAPVEGHHEQLTKLAALRDQGILSEDEFAAKKSEILSRM